LIVDKIEAWACDTPISNPIDLGNFTVRQRSYLGVRVHTSGGLVADCVTQSRGSPLDVVITDVLAPRIVGKDARDVAAISAGLEIELTALELHGAIGRAWSALEICLQDLRAQACGWPLWRMLGGAPRAVPVLVVEGYAIRGEPDDQFIDRLVARADQGFTMIKIETGHYADDAIMLRNLEQFRARAGEKPRLVLDMAWSWSEHKSKLQTLKLLEEMGIDWVEDPFASTQVNSYRALRDSSRLPIGGGDETSQIDSIHALIEADAMDVVRLDATTMGGIEGVRNLGAAARRRGTRVSYHVHPEVHEHLVFGLGLADHVEMFPTDREFDRLHDLTHEAAFDRIVDGHLSPDETPGTGLKIDLEKMAPFVRRHSAFSRH
jgi:L-alanine-DL-glutamate epimerase and related enzymes of enolase superfamily